MTILIALILIFALGGGVISFAVRAAWGILKFFLGLIIFLLFPGILIFAIVMGFFSYVILPVLIIGGILYLVFKQIA